MNLDQLNSKVHTKAELKALCEKFADQLKFEGDRLAFLFALSGNESSFASENRPRFEFGFSRSSLAFRRSKQLQEASDLFGDLSAMSYSAHQILYISARELGFPSERHPLYLQDSNEAMPYVVAFINRLIDKGAKSLEQIAVAYNGGMGALAKPEPRHLQYAKRLRNFYSQLT